MSGAPDFGPLRRRVRQRMMARAGLVVPDLMRGAIPVGEHVRTYALAPGTRPGAPLLLVLHGAGGEGAGMAALCGLATRGPEAGFAVAFPDGWGRVWNDQRGAPRLRRREGIDDVAFLEALVGRLVADGVAAPDVIAVGMSNGAMLAEHMARHERLGLRGIALVAGGATDASVRRRPAPPGGIEVLAFHGTADPLVPYAGGPIGPWGRLVQRRTAGTATTPGGDRRRP